MTRPRITDNIAAAGKYAVFRHRSDLKNARFARLHDTLESATSEARRLANETVTKHAMEEGNVGDFCYYVVRIEGRVGIIDGKICDMA